MKMSFIQAERESGRKTIESNHQSHMTPNVTTAAVWKDVLQLFLLGRRGYGCRLSPTYSVREALQASHQRVFVCEQLTSGSTFRAQK